MVSRIGKKFFKPKKVETEQTSNKSAFSLKQNAKRKRNKKRRK
jgi:hypothetical protein